MEWNLLVLSVLDRELVAATFFGYGNGCWHNNFKSLVFIVSCWLARSPTLPPFCNDSGDIVFGLVVSMLVGI